MAFAYRGKREWLINHPLAGPGDGLTYGAAIVDGPCRAQLRIIFNDATECGWEHVSVSLPNRPPNWAEMAFVKDLFWHEEDAVMQLHPPRSCYVNNHPFCLHLWRPRDATIPLPPTGLV